LHAWSSVSRSRAITYAIAHARGAIFPDSREREPPMRANLIADNQNRGGIHRIDYAVFRDDDFGLHRRVPERVRRIIRW